MHSPPYGTPPPQQPQKRIPIVGMTREAERQQALLAFPYRENLTMAQHNDMTAIVRLKEYFTEREKDARYKARHREYCYKDKSHPNVARLKLITSLLAHLKIGMERIEKYVTACQKQGRTPQIEFWERYEDHQVLSHPYMGTFSFYDQIALLEGIPGVMRGLAQSPCPQYGTISVTEQGWHISYGGKIYPMEPETLHQLVVRNTTVQALPFTAKGVHPSLSWYAPYDGESIVIPSNAKISLDGTLQEVIEFVQYDGETRQIVAPMIRLTMLQRHYAMLVHSVSYPRYQDEQSKASHEATLICFGETRIPRTLIEGEYWLKAHTQPPGEQDFPQFKLDYLAQQMQEQEEERSTDKQTGTDPDLDEQPF